MPAIPKAVLDKESVLERALAYIPGGVNSSLRNVEPKLAPVKAVGAYFWDADGKRYLDYHGAFGPPILGRAHPRLTERVYAAIKEYDLVGVGTSELEADLAAKLVEHVPSMEKVLLCNSGSEATYHALRLARAVTGRRKIVKFQGCYHGFHDSILMNVITPAAKLGQRDVISAGSDPGWWRTPSFATSTAWTRWKRCWSAIAAKSRPSSWSPFRTTSGACCRAPVFWKDCARPRAAMERFSFSMK